MDNILGVCPTCYMVVKSDQPNAQEISSDETIVYHRECEPNRLKFMRDNAKSWKENGKEHKELRESEYYTIAELAEYLEVSESKLRKFEAGKPVTHAKLLGKAYRMFFQLYSARAFAKRIAETDPSHPNYCI